MKSFTRLPLYLGIGVFVLSVILTGTTISDRNYLSRIKSQAGQNTAAVSLVYSKPDLVSVVVNSPEIVEGVDVTLSFDPSSLEILTSTLFAGPSFTTTGGEVSIDGEFTFSAVAYQSSAVKSGVVATFQIVSKIKSETILSFETGLDKTAVFSRTNQKALQLETEDLTLNLSE